jgi:hypothetical protein
VVESDGKLYDHDGDGFPPDGAGVPWVGKQGVAGPPGSQGIGIKYIATVATADLLPASATQGDLYVVSEPSPAHGFVWDADTSAWVDAGPVQGPPGVDGRDGVDGAPSTVPGPPGADGKDGADSTVPGPKGDPGPTVVSTDANNAATLGSDGFLYVAPAATGTPYTLPPATATVLGGVKVGTGLSVDGTGTLSATVATGFLPTTGGEMTGAITLPSGVNGLVIKGTSYNLLGGSGGVAFRNGTSNIINFTGGEVVNYVPITTAGTGIGVRFGSGGPTLSKSGTMIAASAPITVAAAPATNTELANKAYVDAQVAAGGGGSSVTNPVAGSVEGMVLWTGTQAAYDAIATKSAKTVYHITG